MPHDLKQAGTNVIQTCLGNAFNCLPDTVQRAHAGKIRLHGYARVTRGNPIANMMAAVMGLPAATDRGAMSVEGEHLPDRMIWNRQFGDRQFRSCFTLDRGRLFESLGP